METVNLLTSLSKSTMSCLCSRLISMGVMISWGRCCSMRCKWIPWFSQPEREVDCVSLGCVFMGETKQLLCTLGPELPREPATTRGSHRRERQRASRRLTLSLCTHQWHPPRPSLHSHNSGAFLWRPLLSPAGVSPCHSLPVPAHGILDAPHTYGLTGSICVVLNVLIYSEHTKAGER